MQELNVFTVQTSLFSCLRKILLPTHTSKSCLQITEVYGSKTSTWWRSLSEIYIHDDGMLHVRFQSELGVTSGGIAIDDVSIEKTACKYG